MFTETADLYDLIYSSFKDYAAETRAIAELIRERGPHASTILDIGCGTGEHARHLSDLGFAVDGVDVQPEFVEIARAKVPQGRFVCADMIDFELQRTYDVVLCLFSAIGYLRSIERVTEALRAFGRHLNRDGVLLVEPWFTPEAWQPGKIHHVHAVDDHTSVSRMSCSNQRGLVSVLEFHYLVGRTGNGVEYLKEVHELGLFTTDQMIQAFADAPLQVELKPEGFCGRGLYIARRTV